MTILDCGISLRNAKKLALVVEQVIKEISLIFVAKPLELIKGMSKQKQEDNWSFREIKEVSKKPKVTRPTPLQI